jgi:hypothetical protein
MPQRHGQDRVNAATTRFRPATASARLRQGTITGTDETAGTRYLLPPAANAQPAAAGGPPPGESHQRPHQYRDAGLFEHRGPKPPLSRGIWPTMMEWVRRAVTGGDSFPRGRGESRVVTSMARRRDGLVSSDSGTFAFPRITVHDNQAVKIVTRGPGICGGNLTGYFRRILITAALPHRAGCGPRWRVGLPGLVTMAGPGARGQPGRGRLAPLGPKGAPCKEPHPSDYVGGG